MNKTLTPENVAEVLYEALRMVSSFRTPDVETPTWQEASAGEKMLTTSIVMIVNDPTQVPDQKEDDQWMVALTRTVTNLLGVEAA